MTNFYTLTPGEEVDALVKHRMADAGENYMAALDAVLADPANAELKREYAFASNVARTKVLP